MQYVFSVSPSWHHFGELKWSVNLSPWKIHLLQMEEFHMMGTHLKYGFHIGRIISFQISFLSQNLTVIWAPSTIPCLLLSHLNLKRLRS